MLYCPLAVVRHEVTTTSSTEVISEKLGNKNIIKHTYMVHLVSAHIFNYSVQPQYRYKYPIVTFVHQQPRGLISLTAFLPTLSLLSHYHHFHLS